MDRSLLRKMILGALKDYLWEEEDSILTEQEWSRLEMKIMRKIKEEDQEEATYAIIHDVVYDYFTNK
ncbi:YqzH family protein [Fictibacillus phosphorivorans]|uniref:YqzH family protein n=1 Tax=Fictibacillus phosphorivorans TaxID=1221500 RepID=UPI00203D315E|nr:YqzH family protein [Fictibacillus phosphorivorans]MCM3719658.1 YqzH family protein [Fictibacillus phosphorivorans]MCM3777349.1 YqzH family protein [Fictibacillus phosphorivorans]